MATCTCPHVHVTTCTCRNSAMSPHDHGATCACGTFPRPKKDRPKVTKQTSIVIRLTNGVQSISCIRGQATQPWEYKSAAAKQCSASSSDRPTLGQHLEEHLPDLPNAKSNDFYNLSPTHAPSTTQFITKSVFADMLNTCSISTN